MRNFGERVETIGAHDIGFFDDGDVYVCSADMPYVQEYEGVGISKDDRVPVALALLGPPSEAMIDRAIDAIEGDRCLLGGPDDYERIARAVLDSLFGQGDGAQ
jgi:hypothetical protein